MGIVNASIFNKGGHPIALPFGQSQALSLPVGWSNHQIDEETLRNLMRQYPNVMTFGSIRPLEKRKEPSPDSEAPIKEKPLKRLNKKQLLEVAKDRGFEIDPDTLLTKTEIIDVLEGRVTLPPPVVTEPEVPVTEPEIPATETEGPVTETVPVESSGGEPLVSEGGGATEDDIKRYPDGSPYPGPVGESEGNVEPDKEGA